jgi:hypothetical protein
MIPQISNAGNIVNIFVGNQVPFAGNFSLENEKNMITSLAFNYNRSESDLECNSAADLQEMLDKARTGTFTVMKTGQKPLNEVIAQISSGTQLWRYFIWFALLMLLAEVLLIRFFKK